MNLTASASCLLLLVSSASAQYLVRHESFERRMARVTWIGMSGEQRLSVEHGQPKWRNDYAAFATVKQAGQFPLGSGAWTTLHSTVDLAAGDVNIPRGRWYLGLYRDERAAWALTMAAADAVDASGQYVGAFLAKPDVRVPMQLESGASAVEALEVTLAADKQVKRDVTLTLAWGPFRLRAKLVAAVDERVHAGTPEFALSPPDRLVTTKSGLQYEVLEAGSGERPTGGDRVTVHYSGWLLDGTPFDSSHQRGEPSSFPMGAVIAGFAEGLQLMAPGAKYRLTIPPKLGYGERAMGEIPANSTLVFVVHLVKVDR